MLTVDRPAGQDVPKTESDARKNFDTRDTLLQVETMLRDWIVTSILCRPEKLSDDSVLKLARCLRFCTV